MPLPFPLNNPLDECIDKTLSFDEIAEVAVYLYTDVMHEPKAKKAIQKALQRCRTFLSPMVRGVPTDKMEVEVGWDGLYTHGIEEIVSDFPTLKTSVDQWGAKCWTNLIGERECGDDSGFYPWYVKEEGLRKNLKEFAERKSRTQ